MKVCCYLLQFYLNCIILIILNVVSNVSFLFIYFLKFSQAFLVTVRNKKRVGYTYEITLKVKGKLLEVMLSM